VIWSQTAGGPQPAERISSVGRDAVHPPDVAGESAQAQRIGRQRLHMMAGLGQQRRAEPGSITEQDSHGDLLGYML
jgi:hypothetical protein